MFCIKCNAEIPDNSNFCNVCGAKQVSQPKNTKKRGNGQGTVYKRPNNTWAVQVTLGYYLKDGKKKRKTAQKYGFKTKKDALAYMQTLYDIPEKQKRITISELWEIFQNDMNSLSASKRTHYRTAWRKIENDVSYRTIDSFTVSELQNLIENAAPTYGPRMDIKQLLSHFYKIAIRDDYVDKNRTEYVKIIKPESKERQIFNAEEIDTLWSDFSTFPSRVVAGMLTMIYTGMRAGEMLKMRSENVHIDLHYMTGGIKTAKGKNRKIIIPDKIIPVLQYLISEARNGKILYYSPTNDFYNDWKDARARLGIREDLTPYCCRHTYITRLTALKVSPAMLQELAGHEDYDTTLIYTHLSVEDRLKEVNKL